MEVIRIVTAADERYYTRVLAMIASLKRVMPEIGISLYDIGMKKDHATFLSNFVQIKQVEPVNKFITSQYKKHRNHEYRVTGCYTWKPVCVKQELDIYDNVFWLDAGTTPMPNFKWLIEHTINTGFFAIGINDIGWQTTQYVIDKLGLTPEFLNLQALCSAYVGVNKRHYESFVLPMYQHAHNIRMFYDDGTARGGHLSGRQDQTIFSIQAQLCGLPIFPDMKNMELQTFDGIKNGNITSNKHEVNENTCVYHSRGDAEYYNNYDYLKSLL